MRMHTQSEVVLAGVAMFTSFPSSGSALMVGLCVAAYGWLDLTVVP